MGNSGSILLWLLAESAGDELAVEKRCFVRGIMGLPLVENIAEAVKKGFPGTITTTCGAQVVV